MKISVNLSIEIDPTNWVILRDGNSASEVREDIKEYVLYSVQGLAGIQESGAKVTLK